MKLFKESLMQNKKLEWLKFDCNTFENYLNGDDTIITSEALKIFLLDGIWRNTTLKSLDFECKKILFNDFKWEKVLNILKLWLNLSN
jgi:hypothetical protein